MGMNPSNHSQIKIPKAQTNPKETRDNLATTHLHSANNQEPAGPISQSVQSVEENPQILSEHSLKNKETNKTNGA